MPPQPLPAPDARIARLARFYETLSPATIPTLDQVYAADVVFRDPFNDVRGHAALRRILEHMFVQVQDPRFVVTHAMAAGAEGFLVWKFVFRFKGRHDAEQTIRGASHIEFAPDGRVSLHRDYWDAAEELYEKLPLLGGLMRLLRRRLAA